MRKKIFSVLALIIVFLKPTEVLSQSLYDQSAIQRIELFFSQPDWDYQMDTAKHGADSYIFADYVLINGSQFDSVGVKYKGNSSYDSTYKKNPIHISLNEFKKQNFQGYKDIKLGNGFDDPSLIREVLAYDILGDYMDCSLANFAELYINGSYVGLYSNVESVNSDFCSNHFYSSSHTFIKCNPIVNPNPTTKSSLRYISGGDSSNYQNFYEIKSDYGWNELVALCDTIANHPSSSSTVLDMDRAIWMLAFNNLTVNLDSYTGVFAQNYYLYKDNNDRFLPVVWDLNMCFGGFPFAGGGATGLGSLTIADEQQLSPDFHATDPYWPLINAVMNNATWKKMYFAHLRTMANEQFSSHQYDTLAAYYSSLIDASVSSDSNKFFSYSQFQTAMTSNTTIGSYEVPGIKTLMDARISYLQTNASFTAVPPVISTVICDNTSPQLNVAVNITAAVSNTDTSSVYLGFSSAKENPFVKIRMYDDGLHSDGGAGDGVFGASITIDNWQIRYYVYAENNDAGVFSPERAEHEFYTVTAQIPTAVSGEVVINEFLAVNQNDTTDEAGTNEDWIEFYNLTSAPLSLYGLFLSDNISNLQKFSFPANAIIPANGYLTIFADEDPSTAQFIHCNFKLSGNGELLILSSLTGIIDSISFPAPLIDVSVGRCPNGTGNFVTQGSTTFNTQNCTVGIDEILSGNEFYVYPNPATNNFYVLFKNGKSDMPVIIYNSTGEEICRKESDSVVEFNTETWAKGIYIARCGMFGRKILVMNCAN